MKEDAIIRVNDLHFGYKPQSPILKGLNLEVPQGSIYGFLGANGAGKSTTIRNILGLLKPASGKVELFGKDPGTHRLEILQKVGSLIESPSLYKQLDARDNLRIYCQYRNIGKKRIEEVLEITGLQKHKRKATKDYSTGMKQRLGLAIALLSDPDLLILDEPTNGLDPVGILEIRNIIRQLHAQGKTIFLSSHLLSEIEKIASRVGILKDGNMLFQGSIEELKKIRNQKTTVLLKTSEAKKVSGLIPQKTRILDDQSLEVELQDREELPDLLQSLTRENIRIYEVRELGGELENHFIQMTNPNQTN
ncbi:MAG: ATP-binding cassette domain-containing protein [Bacteroidetes bacterium]|nr:ATP-binding cassette domain-containing protein [Bacteroidota bacterium]